VLILCISFCVYIIVYVYVYLVVSFFSLSFVDLPSVLWYCWLGLLTCKNRLPYNLYCVVGDVKHCSLTHSLFITETYYYVISFYMLHLINIAFFCIWCNSIWRLEICIQIGSDAVIVTHYLNLKPVPSEPLIFFINELFWYWCLVDVIFHDVLAGGKSVNIVCLVSNQWLSMQHRCCGQAKLWCASSRAVPDFGSGSGRNPALFPNPAEIRLRQKSHASRIVLLYLKSRRVEKIF